MKTFISFIAAMLISIFSFSQSPVNQVNIGHDEMIGHNSETLVTYLKSNEYVYEAVIDKGHCRYVVSDNSFFVVNLSTKTVDGFVIFVNSNSEEIKYVKEYIELKYKLTYIKTIDNKKVYFVRNKSSIDLYLATWVENGNTIYLFYPEKK